MAHLNMAPGEEVVPVGDLLPSPKEGQAELFKFHKLLAQHHNNIKNEIVGVQVHHPSSDIMRMLRATEPAAWPLFKRDEHPAAEPQMRVERRINTVDSGIVLRLGERSDRTLDVAEYSPAIVLSGSRYTYFAPHTIGLAADRNGLVSYSCAERWTTWDNAVLESSHVILRDNEPVRVGSVRASALDVRSILDCAKHCALHVGHELRAGDLVLLAGFHARLPVSSSGRFVVNMGPFGGEVHAVLR